MERKEYKVSVLVTTYNHEKYIAKCLNSLLDQVTDFDYEILIHDDVSTDHTSIILEEYRYKFPNIRVIRPSENRFSKGDTGFLMNDMLQLSEGKYWGICEGDDYFLDPSKLQKQVNFLDNHLDHTICFHPVEVVYQNNSQPNSVFPPKDMLDRGLELPNLIFANFIQTNSVMYRKIGYADIPKTSFIPGDWFLHVYHARAGKIGYIDEIMSVYRRHENGLWSGSSQHYTFWRKNGDNHLFMLIEMLRLFPNNPEIKLHIYKKISQFSQKSIRVVSDN